MAGWIRTAVGMDVDVACRMVLWRRGAKVLSWNVSGNEFLSLQRGVLKLGMTDVFHVGELIPRPKTMKDMNEPMRARAMHMMVINTWMNPNTEQKIYTAPESQFCQALRRYNCENDGLRLSESEQMDRRGAGVVQTTSWALIAVVASMVPMARMASMAPVVASMASMASMSSMVAPMAPVVDSVDLVTSMASIVAAPMGPMVSLIWMVLKAPEIKSEREEVQRFGAHLLHPALCIKHLCFAFDQMSSWYSAAGYGWYGPYGSWYGRRRGSWDGKSEVRSDVEWFCQKCGTGSWWSRTDCRHCVSVTNDDADALQTSAQEKIAVLEKTLAGMGRRRAYFSWQEGSGERTRQTPKEAQWSEEKRQSTSRPNKIGSTENPNVSSQRVQNWRSGKRASECEKKL